MNDKERAAEYLKRSVEARREARCVMDPIVRAGFHRIADEYERMSAAVIKAAGTPHIHTPQAQTSSGIKSPP